MSKLEEFRQKSQEIVASKKDQIEAQHKAGKKTARERIESLLDDASFIEIDKFVKKTYATPGFEAVSETGEGVVCGYGTIEERPVFIYAQDYTVLKGSLSAAHASKILKTLDMALKNGVPVIGILDSDGARISEGVAAIDAYASVIGKFNEISGVVPTITVIAGNCIGTAAYIASTTDFCFMIDEISTLSLYGPQIYASTLEKEVDLGAKKHNQDTGVSQFMCANEDECYTSVRKLLGYLPANNLDDSPYIVPNDDINRPIAYDGEAAYDTLELVRAIADNNDILEYQAMYSPEIVTAFGRLNGVPVGFVANACGSDITGHAARKASRFISLLDAYSIPVITLADAGGTPVTDQNNMLISNITRLIGVYASATIPKITIICGRAVGDGYATMCPKALGADIVYAWPSAQISAMPAEMGAIVLYEDEIKASADGVAAKQQMIQKYKDEYANPWQAAEQGVIDDIIDPAATRQLAGAALEMCISRRVEALPKRHRVATL
ncbi:MAG: acyl-CoA carboxylase subunit beta [Christensenellaceae bacterium]|jgi:acetyl-CoA carboxylase carboxyltransferase component